MTENMGVYVKAHRVIHQTLNTVYASLYESLGKRMARVGRSRKNKSQFTALGIVPQLFIFNPEPRDLELEFSQYLFQVCRHGDHSDRCFCFRREKLIFFSVIRRIVKRLGYFDRILLEVYIFPGESQGLSNPQARISQQHK